MLLLIKSRFQSFDLFKGMIKMLFKIWIITLVAKMFFCEGIFFNLQTYYFSNCAVTVK